MRLMLIQTDTGGSYPPLSLGYLAATAARAGHEVSLIDLQIPAQRERWETLLVDGGLTNAGRFMQFQADILGLPVAVSRYPDVTARGTAMLAAWGIGDHTPSSFQSLDFGYRLFGPSMSDPDRAGRVSRWQGLLRKHLAGP